MQKHLYYITNTKNVRVDGSVSLCTYYRYRYHDAHVHDSDELGITRVRS